MRNCVVTFWVMSQFVHFLGAARGCADFRDPTAVFRIIIEGEESHADEKPIHPGKIIKHSIEASGWNVTDAAEWLDVTRQTLSRVMYERTVVSPEMAIRVSKVFGLPPEHWLKIQMAYDLAQMQKKAASIKVKRFAEVELLPH